MEGGLRGFNFEEGGGGGCGGDLEGNGWGVVFWGVNLGGFVWEWEGICFGGCDGMRWWVLVLVMGEGMFGYYMFGG